MRRFLSLVALSLLALSVNAEQTCKTVEGHFEASVVPPGVAFCPASVPLCTEGRVWGGPTFGQTLFSFDTRTKKAVNTGAICDGGGEVYDATEAANGELGWYLVSDGGGRPYKVHVRAPGFPILAGVPRMVTGKMLADLIPTFDTINMIGGEVEQ